MISHEEIRDTLKKATHPELNKNFIELSMIRKIEAQNSKITVILVTPFLHVPIEEQLIKIIKEIIKKNLNINVNVKVEEMNHKEKKKFGETVRKIRGYSL